jgi:hypothetical protein
MGKKYPLPAHFVQAVAPKDKGPIFTQPEVDNYIIEYYLIY